MPHTVLAYVTDLIFQTKLSSTARAIGVDLRITGGLDKLTQLLDEQPVRTVIVDLNAGGDTLGVLRALRARNNPPRILCYVAHVQKEVAETAAKAGADEVLPRSQFSTQLPQILAAAAED